MKKTISTLKRSVNKALSQTGYEIKQVLYRPWLEDWFQSYYLKAKPRTLVTVDRCYVLHQFARQCIHLPGDFAECGVYKGGTAHLLAETLQRNDGTTKNIYLFDTFEGMPGLADIDDGPHRKGDFGDTSLKSVKGYLCAFNNIEYRQGLIPETFQQVEAEQFSFVHVDVDLYQTALDCATYFYEKMPRGAVMIFDDYGFEQYRNAARKAVDEFFANKPEVPVTLLTGQCLVIKV